MSLLRGAVRAENVGGLRSKRRRVLSLGAVSVARGVLPALRLPLVRVCFRSRGAEVVPLLVLSAALRSSSAGAGVISLGSAVSRSRKMQQNNACYMVISK